MDRLTPQNSEVPGTFYLQELACLPMVTNVPGALDWDDLISSVMDDEGFLDLNPLHKIMDV